MQSERKGRIVAISGSKGSGKSTLAESLRQAFWRVGLGSRIAPLAGKLKDACEFSFGIPERQLYGTDDERNLMTLYGFPEQLTTRQFMQQFGQKMREIDPAFWLKLWSKSYGSGLSLVPDVRFRNELEYFTRLGAFTVRLLRKPLPDDPNVSEHDLDSVPNSVFNLVLHQDLSADEVFNITWLTLLKWLTPTKSEPEVVPHV